ncbi:MAG TPA: hypothetical protein VI141_01090 [Acidimicrobiia bacterium]
MRRPSARVKGNTIWRVAITEVRCSVGTTALLLRHRLLLPATHVGTTVKFGDGSASRVYRETVLRGVPGEPGVVIAVKFRLKGVGSSRIWHALFRLESLFNTLLFAAWVGFRTKLWLTDLETGYYRGIYEWQDGRSAMAYLETLDVVLRPWIERGSFAYRVIETSRNEYLGGLLHADGDSPATQWWLPVI